MLSPAQTTAIAKQVATIAGHPIIYGPNNKILPSSAYSYQRTAAKRKGSLKNWIPQRLFGKQSEAMERQRVVERSVDLTNNDPQAAGIVDTFATTIVGSGLNPHPAINYKALGIDKKAARTIQAQQKSVFETWAPFADAGGRMNFASIQFLVQRNLLQYGEYLVLLPMIDDPLRPYSLACQVINPMRLKTPNELIHQTNIRDGVELGQYGEPVAYWIKKAGDLGIELADTRANFIRIQARKGHRRRVLHGFVCQEPEQVRGWPYFAPAMKFFKDFNDYLDAELVSNIVTASFALFIEVGGGVNPLYPAQNFASETDTFTNANGNSEDTRYQEWIPGQIMYGNTGEKPHPITSQRPGATFEPFTEVVKKAISMSLNIPYPVLFKDFKGMNYASYRSAMLEAWRVYGTRRTWLGFGFCQPVYQMLQEEAYLRGNLDVKDFYTNPHALTRAKFIGPPKGQIEPIKEINAEIIAIQNNLKTREAVLLERGEDFLSTAEQLEEEQEILSERGLDEVKLDMNTAAEEDKADKEEEK